MDLRRVPLGKCVIASVVLYSTFLIWTAVTSKVTLEHFKIPFVIVAVLGLYAITNIAFGVYRFNRSDEGLEELKKVCQGLHFNFCRMLKRLEPS